MADIICPNCEKIVSLNPQSRMYECRYCGWNREEFPGAELLELKRENFRLKEQIKAFRTWEEITLKPGDIRYCIYSGNAEHKACVLKCELYRITTNHLKTTYSFKPLESDYPSHLSYSTELNLRTFSDQEKAEKKLRSMLSKRRHKDGCLKPVKSQRQIANEKREKYFAEQAEDDDFDEFDS